MTMEMRITSSADLIWFSLPTSTFIPLFSHSNSLKARSSIVKNNLFDMSLFNASQETWGLSLCHRYEGLVVSKIQESDAGDSVPISRRTQASKVLINGNGVKKVLNNIVKASTQSGALLFLVSSVRLAKGHTHKNSNFAIPHPVEILIGTRSQPIYRSIVLFLEMC